MKRAIVIAGAALVVGAAGVQASTFDWRDGQGPGSPPDPRISASRVSAQPDTFDRRSGQGPGSAVNHVFSGDAPANQDVSRGGRTGQGPAAQP